MNSNSIMRKPSFGFNAGTGLTMRPNLFDFDSWFTDLGINHRSSLYQVDNAYVLQFPMPGVREEAVDITVNGRTVTVTAQYEIAPPECATPVWQGDVAGEIRESFTLPSEVYSDESSATYDNGVLTLTLPKSEKTHKIKINSK